MSLGSEKNLEGENRGLVRRNAVLLGQLQAANRENVALRKEKAELIERCSQPEESG